MNGSDAFFLNIGQDAELYKHIQRLRMMLNNRIKAVERGDSLREVDLDRETHRVIRHYETLYGRRVEKQVRRHPLWTEWLCHVRGLGLLSTGQLLGAIGRVNLYHNRISAMDARKRNDRQRQWAAERGIEPKPTGIGAFDTVSALWKFAGLAPGQRPVKGERLSYDKELKTLCLGIVGDCIIRANGSYKRLYDEKKAYYEAERPEWTQGRRHNAARRFMVKVFLSHLWERWREMEGYPTRLLYVTEKLGHTHVHRWPDFVDPTTYEGDALEVDDLELDGDLDMDDWPEAAS